MKNEELKMMKAQIHQFNDWVHETDPIFLFNKYDTLLKKAWFKIISYQEKHFEPYWYTWLWLLSESHFAIHTFPECWKTYIELASCILDKYKNFIELL